MIYENQNFEYSSDKRTKMNSDILKMLNSEDCDHIESLITEKETNLLYLIQIMLPPSYVRMIANNKLKIYGDDLKQLLITIRKNYKNIWMEYDKKIQLLDHYSNELSKENKNIPPQKNNLKEKKENILEKKYFSRTIFERSVDLKCLNSFDELFGKILFFQKVNFGVSVQYKLFSQNLNDIFEDRYYLHKENTRTIEKQFITLPDFVSGQVIEVQQSKGDHKYNLQSGTSIVIIKVDPQ
eukprot:gene2454-3164_t